MRYCRENGVAIEEITEFKDLSSLLSSLSSNLFAKYHKKSIYKTLFYEILSDYYAKGNAKLFVAKKKGHIKEGFLGDLTIIDMKMRKKVRNDSLFTKCGWSPFDGYELRGWPVKTIVNGNLVFDDGEIYENVKGKEMEFARKG